MEVELKPRQKIIFWTMGIICVMLIKFSPVYADNEKRTGNIGFSASFQGPQLDYLIPIWTSEQTVILPSFRIIHIGETTTDIGLGFGIRHNIKGEKAVSYLGFRTGALVLFPQGGETMADFIGGSFFGGEYFLGSKFSAGVEAQINISVSHKHSYRFGNPGKMNLNSSTSVYVTFYFK